MASTALAGLVEDRLQVGGVRTRALRLDGEGPTIVLLHGFADSADTWLGVLAHLRAAGRAAVAVDLPGFAHADRLRDRGGVLEQVGEFAAAASEQFANGAGSTLAGNSLGGAAALIAAAAGAPVGEVVAIAPAGFDLGGWIYRLQNFSLLTALLRAPPVIPGPLLRAIVGQAYRQLAICEQRSVATDVVARFASHHRDRATVLRYLGTAQRLLPELGEPLAIDGIEVPVLLVWGRQDRMLPVRNVELVVERVPHATVKLLDPCGHCPQVEQPRVVAALLTRGS